MQTTPNTSFFCFASNDAPEVADDHAVRQRVLPVKITAPEVADRDVWIDSMRYELMWAVGRGIAIFEARQGEITFTNEELADIIAENIAWEVDAFNRHFEFDPESQLPRSVVTGILNTNYQLRGPAVGSVLKIWDTHLGIKTVIVGKQRTRFLAGMKIKK
jgi:hypothetical protein